MSRAPTRLCWTGAGRRLVAACDRATAPVEELMLSGLSGAQVSMFREALTNCLQALQPDMIVWRFMPLQTWVEQSRWGYRVFGTMFTVFAAIALVHPAILLRRHDRRAHLSVALAVTLATLAGALGASLYPSYRERLRQPIFAQAPGMGYLFERKEHLAFGAVLLAWAGAIAYVAAIRYAEVAGRDALRKAAHWAFVASAVLTVVTALLGTIVASYRTF